MLQKYFKITKLKNKNKLKTKTKNPTLLKLSLVRIKAPLYSQKIKWYESIKAIRVK